MSHQHRPDAWDGLRSPLRGEPIRAVPLPTIVTTRTHEPCDVERLLRSGALERVSRGTYALSSPRKDWHARTRERIASVAETLTGDFVFVGPTAAIVLGLWVGRDNGLVHVACPSRRPGRSTGPAWLRRHYFDIPSDQIHQIDGATVTSVARTAVDCARLFRLPHALPTVDAALVIGVPRTDMEAILSEMAGYRGVVQARLAVELGRLSGSPKESSYRGEVVEEGLPMPETLISLDFPDGSRREVDLGYHELRLGYEVHGVAKYSNGATIADEEDKAEAATTIGWTLHDLRTSESREERMRTVSRTFRRAWLRRYGQPWTPE